MCNVYNTIGSLTTIKAKLEQNNIHDFTSVDELISFRENHASSRQQIISTHQTRITEEQNNLSVDVRALESEIAKDRSEREQHLNAELDRLRQKRDTIVAMKKSYLQEITHSYVVVFLMLRIKYNEFFFKSKVFSAIRLKVNTLTKKSDRLQYITGNFEQAVQESYAFDILYHDRKKRIIDEINPFIYGAIGEEKVVKTLESLPDEYTLINDFCLSFDKPIYYHQERQYIKTVQIDHLLVSPAGIFLIETKNWSRDSLNNLSLRSPVNQIKRANFALYKILSGSHSFLARHHWGERKIPIRNLIVMINQKPPEEFEYVKVLTLGELDSYIEYFKPCLSGNETKQIFEYLIKLARRN